MKPALILKPALLSVFFLTCLAFLFPSKLLAMDLVLSQVPQEIKADEEFSSHFYYKTTSKNQKYYLRPCFYLSGTSDYFGCIKNLNSEWICGTSADKTKYLEIETNDEGVWEGDLRIKAESGNGNHEIKIKRYTAGGSSEDSNSLSIRIIAAIQSLEPSPVSVISQSESNQKATCKINDVKDIDGQVLSSVKIYIDGTYTGHYAPETFTFCEGCKDGGFGDHVIKLEKSSYQDWSETKNFKAGDSFEINPQLVLLEPSQEPSLAPSPSVKVSVSPSVLTASVLPQPQTVSSKSYEINLLSPVPSTQSSVLGEKSEPEPEKPTLIPIIFSTLGLGLMGMSFGPKLLASIRDK